MYSIYQLKTESQRLLVPGAVEVRPQQLADDHWRFSTVHTWECGEHPVSGTREFGIHPQRDDSYLLETRGADRCTGLADMLLSAALFGGAHATWFAFLTRAQAFVEQHGGNARVVQQVASLHHWSLVQHEHFHPTGDWITEPAHYGASPIETPRPSRA
jgi:hypothetical protein